uniref:SGNH hydrolase-type esterase domain-containing protein n=1 Tax=Salix viminalis TaxID=40686 RepID=A0A6N2N736_SALVM
MRANSMSNIKNCFLVFCASLLVARSCRGSKHVALFIFGDSLYDAGNNKYIEDAPIFSDFWPYGETFFKHPTGRPCDGRLIPDFIAEYANLPLIPPYLQPGNNQFMEGENFESKGDRVLAENLQGMVISSEIQEHVQSGNHHFVNGVNFASSGAGALVETHQGWVINLSTQLSYFKNMKRQLGLQLGEAEAQKLLSTAVYMFSIGGNDYFEALTPMHSLLQFYSREEAVKQEQTGVSGCMDEATMFAKLHNTALSKALEELERQLEGFRYSNFDAYIAGGERINNPSKYGFKEVREACCGNGPYRSSTTCGQKGYQLCENASEYSSLIRSSTESATINLRS